MSLLKKLKRKITKPSIWARPQMQIIFRAELMPGKNRQERTFKIEKVLSNGRVILQDFAGEHRESEFEPIRFDD
jgi:hypothetical protein